MKTIIDKVDFLKKSYYSIKHWKKIAIAGNEINRKIPVATNSKQYSQSYIKSKNIKLVTH